MQQLTEKVSQAKARVAAMQGADYVIGRCAVSDQAAGQLELAKAQRLDENELEDAFDSRAGAATSGQTGAAQEHTAAQMNPHWRAAW